MKTERTPWRISFFNHILSVSLPCSKSESNVVWDFERGVAGETSLLHCFRWAKVSIFNNQRSEKTKALVLWALPSTWRQSNTHRHWRAGLFLVSSEEHWAWVVDFSSSKVGVWWRFRNERNEEHLGWWSSIYFELAIITEGSVSEWNLKIESEGILDPTREDPLQPDYSGEVRRTHKISVPRKYRGFATF